MNNKHEAILNTPLPDFVANIRHLDRKSWAFQVRYMLRRLGLGWVSVTTPNHSMASSITIRFHSWTPEEQEAHKAEHARIDERERGSGSWLGYGTYCPYCREVWEAHNKLEAIILAAFPDLADRSNTASDYFNFCLSIE